MALCNYLSNEDKSIFCNWINMYGGMSDNKDPDLDVENVDHILRFWDKEKVTLWKMLGEKFTISKDVTFKRSERQSRSDFEDCLGYWRGGYKFIREYQDFTADKRNLETPESYHDPLYKVNRFEDIMALRELTTFESLHNNIYTGDTFTITRSDDGQTMLVNKGAKISKLLGKLTKFFELSEAKYEEFRIAHSQFLNQDTIKGTLCLSIHPMDYVTMSDNDCDWDSCMNWRNEGDYRIGTVEMMNSPCVLVAYLRAKEDMEFGWGEKLSHWNNKKWRQLYIITKDLISDIRQYPWHNDELNGLCMKWIRDLAATNLGWQYSNLCTYYNNFRDADYNNFCLELSDKPYSINVYCDKMYNDVYSKNQKCFIGIEAPHEIDIDYSGYSECMNCGEEIGDISDTCMLLCDNCSNAIRCSCCGDMIHYDDYYWIDDDTCLCYDCYTEKAGTCEDCGDVFYNEDLNEIRLYKDNKLTWRSGYLCYNCKSDYEEAGLIISDPIQSSFGVHYRVDFETLMESNSEAADRLRDIFSINSEEGRQWFLDSLKDQSQPQAHRPTLVYRTSDYQQEAKITNPLEDMLWDNLNKALQEVIESYRAIGITPQQLKDGLVTIPEEEMTEKAADALKEYYEQFVDFKKVI